jgi:glycosyltransferase involved in cell wall biosynthesis
MASVSVIIPIYNGERYIRETLDSVFAQTYQDYEIVCVDDGSDDGTLAVLHEYGSKIHLIRQTNTGQAGARNASVKQAGGKYLAFLDQDDLWHPEKLEQQVVAMETSPECVLVHCDMDTIDAIGNVIQRNVVSATHVSTHKGLRMTQLVGWDPNIYPSTMLIRRDAFERIGGFDSELRCGEDIDLMIRLKHEGSFIFLGQSWTQYRKHGTNFSGSGSDKMFKCSVFFFQKIRRFYTGDKSRQKLIDKFLANVYSDWGKMKMRLGLRVEARRLLLTSLTYNPWQFRTYSRLLRATAWKLNSTILFC